MAGDGGATSSGTSASTISTTSSSSTTLSTVSSSTIETTASSAILGKNDVLSLMSLPVDAKVRQLHTENRTSYMRHKKCVSNLYKLSYLSFYYFFLKRAIIMSFVTSTRMSELHPRSTIFSVMGKAFGK